MDQFNDSATDQECKHGLTTRTCALCRGTGPTGSTRRRGSGGTKDRLDTPESVEKYRSRYSADRQATFDAYKDVYFRATNPSGFPGGWTMFSRCANAEPSLVANEPRLVERAEALMRAAGYENDDSERAQGKGRRWFRPSSHVR